MSKPCDNCGSDLKVCKDCDLYTGKYVKAEIKTELEEIKVEINQIDMHQFKRTEVLKILDNHISELKNEENE